MYAHKIIGVDLFLKLPSLSIFSLNITNMLFIHTKMKQTTLSWVYTYDDAVLNELTPQENWSILPCLCFYIRVADTQTDTQQSPRRYKKSWVLCFFIFSSFDETRLCMLLCPKGWILAPAAPACALPGRASTSVQMLQSISVELTFNSLSLQHPILSLTAFVHWMVPHLLLQL